MPLTAAPCGRKIKVVKLIVDVKVRKHFENLGLTEGTTITVVSQSGGSVICRIKEERLALDKNLAAKILVS